MRYNYELGATVSLLTLLTLARGATSQPELYCPEACMCADGSQLELECAFATGNISIEADPAKYITLTCSSGTVQCEQLPRLPVPRFEPIKSFGLRSCPLSNDSLVCTLLALGVPGTTALTLQGTAIHATTLAVHHVAELLDLRTLSLLDVGELKIPHEAIAVLPTLRRLTIRNSFLHLDSDAFSNSPPLEYLELSLDSIKLLPRGAFRGLSTVRVLGLWGNDIAEVNEAAFEGLDSLERLDLSSNSIRLLSAGCFNATPHLKEIRISKNPLDKITNATFLGLSLLETVVLEDTGSRELKIEDRAFASLPSLVALRLSRCRVRQLAADVFQASGAIRNLTLSRNRLQHLPDGLLRDQLQLEFLDLSYNEIKELTADLFASLKQLRELNLDKNLITTLPESVFFGLSRVKSISINNNRIENISETALKGINEIERMSLANNSLRLGGRAAEVLVEYFDFGPSSPFSWLPTLRFLDLSGNRIDQIFSDWRLVLIKLDFLDLSRNSISELTETDINFLSRSVFVDLSGNNITRIFLRPSFEEIETSADDSNTARILLDNNPLICDCELYDFVRLLNSGRKFFVGPVLDPGSSECVSPAELSGRHISDLPSVTLICELPNPACPRDCQCVIRPETATLEMDCKTQPLIDSFPKPAVYHLNNTLLRLRSTPASIDALPPHVRKLNLSGIGLREVPPELALLNLDLCDLTNNQLSSIPVQLLNRTEKLRISKNPFACDCPHAARVAEIQLYGLRVSDYEELKCSNGDVLWRVDSAHLCDKTIVAGSIVLVMAIGAIAAIAVLLRKFDREVKTFLYSRGWFQRWLREELDRNKLYDVFISFSHRDVSIVQDELLPKLESAPYFYKTCVHYRDWGAGDCIPVQIQRSVERSRRTIILLSRNFLESEWAALEFRAAYKQTLTDTDSRLIVVFLEDVRDDPRLDEDLQAYIANNTYVKWGETWFWKKLVYALPRRHITSKNKAKTQNSGAEEKISSVAGLQVQLNCDGKLVNAGSLKNSVISVPPSSIVHF